MLVQFPVGFLGHLTYLLWLIVRETMCGATSEPLKVFPPKMAAGLLGLGLYGALNNDTAHVVV